VIGIFCAKGLHRILGPNEKYGDRKRALLHQYLLGGRETVDKTCLT
jgi:hypothetical protein